MKKWISLCLALTLAGNTALFGAEEVKKETPRNSLLVYAKPIAKIILGVGGAFASVNVLDGLSNAFRQRDQARRGEPVQNNILSFSDKLKNTITLKNIIPYYRKYLKEDASPFTKTAYIALESLPFLASLYLAFQGAQELKQMYYSSKELAPTDEQAAKKRKVTFADEVTEYQI